MLERTIERRVCEYAQSKHVLAYKFSSPNHAAVPDRIFINVHGTVWFVEFKRLGGKPTPQQQREHDRLRRQGCTVLVIDSVESGKFMVDMMA